MRPGQGLFVFHSPFPQPPRPSTAREASRCDSEGGCAALLSLLGAVACRDFGSQLTKRFLDFLARCIGRGANWAALFRRQLSGGHDDALDVRAHLGENALHVKIFAHGSSYYGVARRAPAHRTTSAICLDREKCPAARRGCRAFPPRCLALGFQFIAMRARYEFADPLTLISARRTLTCRRNGLSRCFAVMSQLPTDAVEKSGFLLIVTVFRLRCTGSCY